jgi:peptide/nickel transport system ATP-binding protein
MQMIFQDPYASLNPRMRVVDIVGEAPVAHGLVGAKSQAEYVAQQMNRVGLDGSLMRRFPHQFSGGQRARIGIARALAVAPEFLVCDESVAALDVSIQAQVLNLFMDLKSALNLLIFSSATTWAWSSTSAIASSSCIWGVSSSRDSRPSFTPRPIIRTRRRCSRKWARSSPQRTFVPIKGEIPLLSRHRRAATSIPAARTSCQSAGRWCRHCGRSLRHVFPPVI